jgi:L-ascorbate metabolism protein UlaG (beta-lactamase superfamily)
MGSFSMQNVDIVWLGHSTFELKSDKTIFIDPYQVNTEDKADVILLTHSHYDHCSIEDIKKISNENTIIITVPDCQSKLASIADKVKNITLVKPGDKLKISALDLEVVPSYNIGKMFHPKEQEWVGYIVTLNNLRIYHAGDSDLIPEMNEIKADIALLPIGGKFTMDVEEAAKACEKINPKIAVPMHYGSIVGSNEDAEKFKNLCSCEVKLL